MNEYPKDQESLIAEYQKLAYSIAYSYRSYGVPLEDLKQESLIGLLSAYDHFDPTMNTKFSTYAVYWIKKYILSAISKEHHASLNASELNQDIVAEAQQGGECENHDEELRLPKDMPLSEQQVLIMSYQKKMTLKEISQHLNISIEKVKQIRQKAIRRYKQSNDITNS